MSQGRVVEQGSHDELYARDGMYRGVVDAQRISAESAADSETEPSEEAIKMEAISQCLPSDFPRPSIAAIGSSIFQKKVKESGVIAKTQYSPFYLLKKASLF